MWRERYNWFQDRLKQLEAEAAQNGGKLKRSDHWRATYYRDPYFVRATDEEYFQRFCDVFHNQVYLTENGHIAPLDVLQNDSNLMRKFTSLMEEQSFRVAITGELIQAANEPLNKYFDGDGPIGVNLFKSVDEPSRPYLVKFSKKKYVEQMLKTGTFRVSPASLYSNGSLLHAQQDLETEREFVIPTYDKILKGYDHVNVEGMKFNVTQNDPQIRVSVPDYYLLSLCRDLDRRMPTDFDADAALIIKDYKKFQRLFFDQLRDTLKGWDFKNGEVDYYDPYLDFKRYKVPEMTKHFRFHYQKEFRIVARPKQPVTTDLEPIFVEIGPMDEYAEMCSV